VLLDRIRAVDKSRLARKLGCIDETDQTKVLATLAEMLAE
jgi:mRNA-degrading endonuclease toxin of MazEF toxin-antitoxin module